LNLQQMCQSLHFCFLWQTESNIFFCTPKLLCFMSVYTRFNVPHSTSIQRNSTRKKVMIIADCSLDSNTGLQTSVPRCSCPGYFYLSADKGARWNLHMLRHWSFIFWPLSACSGEVSPVIHFSWMNISYTFKVADCDQKVFFVCRLFVLFLKFKPCNQKSSDFHIQ
jgi:hypothetical protein